MTILFKLGKNENEPFRLFKSFRWLLQIILLAQQHTNLFKCQSLGKPHQKSVITAVSCRIPELPFSSRGHCMTSGGHKAARPERGTAETAVCAWLKPRRASSPPNVPEHSLRDVCCSCASWHWTTQLWQLLVCSTRGYISSLGLRCSPQRVFFFPCTPAVVGHRDRDLQSDRIVGDVLWSAEVEFTVNLLLLSW